MQMDIGFKSILGPHSRSLWPRRHHSSREKSDALQSKATPLTSPLPQGRWHEHSALSRPRPRSAVTAADAHKDSDYRPLHSLHTSVESVTPRRTASSRNEDLRISPPTRELDMWNARIESPSVRDLCYGASSSDYTRSQDHESSPSYPSYMPQQSGSLSRHAAMQASSPQSMSAHRDTYDTSQTDTILSDEDEVHLFAQAIVGFGHEEPFAMQPVAQAASSMRQGHRPPMLRTQSEQPLCMAPAYEETPTTLFALHGLAAMPQPSAMYRHHDTLSYTMAEPSIIPSSTSYSYPHDDPSSWTIASPEHSFPSHTEHPDVSPIDDDDEDAACFGRDEPPDYAASQAQVYVSQRIEATKRAQELQRRWRQAH